MAQAALPSLQIYLNCMGRLDSLVVYLRFIEALLLTDQKEEALKLADQAIAELGQSTRSSSFRVKVLLALGRTREAVEEAQLVDRTDTRYGQTLAVALAAAGATAQAGQEAEAWLALKGLDEGAVLELLAFLHRREEANALAAAMDQRPGGHIAVTGAILGCLCGAPFDIEATPNFKSLIEQGGLQWPPSAPISLP
jgi:hypothetical protein